MNIRSETPQDYAAITALHIRAFGDRMSEALIVALHRQRQVFDPELSLVAEVDGRVVGHALFSPQSIRLLGENRRAVNLAPIAVEPDAQGQGIGSRLIEQGHALAADKGYLLSFLLGHSSYYPRFGYQTFAYGSAALVAETGAAEDDLEQRAPQERDVPALAALWQREEAEVDFAIFPGHALADWLSPNPAIEALVWLREGVPVGYTRTHESQPAQPRMFLAYDDAAARTMVAMLAARDRAAGLTSQLMLPLHPASRSASALGSARADAWEAAMACPLRPGPLDDYVNQVRAGTRVIGRPIWPVAFDL